MSWPNMDASIGFSFNCFDSNYSNSNRFYRQREDSQSYHPPFFQQQDQEPYMYDNTINFAQVPPFQDQEQDSDNSQKQLTVQQDSPQWINQGSTTKRGLRSLAELLLKILKKKSLLQAEIVSLIEDILCKGRHQEGGKQEKNIKRRIYDALNVMIAAGLLQKQNSSIKIKKKSSSHLFLEIQPLKIEQIQARMEKKKELLGKLISQKNALKYWIQRNKTKSENQLLIEGDEQLYFPLIFVTKGEQKLRMKYLNEFFLMKDKHLQLYSETDIIEIIYHLQICDKNLLISDAFE